jgi:hypothetical protein
MATATRPRKSKDKPDIDVHDALAKAELILSQIHTFTDAISFHETELTEARADVTEKKGAYDAARENLRELENALSGTKDSLYRFLCPKRGQFMPLFDKMEDADEDLHGEGATQWRTEPVANLKLSPLSMQCLNDADIVVIGQLQDRIINAPGVWWESIEGITAAMAAAITDKLNDLIFERTKR